MTLSAFAALLELNKTQNSLFYYFPFTYNLGSSFDHHVCNHSPASAPLILEHKDK